MSDVIDDPTSRFDRLAERHAERFFEDLDRLKEKFGLSDAHIGRLIATRCGDLEDLWLEWTQEAEQ